MRRLLLVLFALVVASCGPDHHDIVGPFTGQTFRFVVDHLTLPQKGSDFAVDLDGDRKVDNQLGKVVGTLASNGYAASPDDQIAAGSLVWSIEITTDDPSLMNDSTVGVRFFSRDGEPSDELGGTLVNGSLHTNPTATLAHSASATLRLPILPDADAITLSSIGVEIDLERDGEGFAGTIAGGLPSPTYLAPAAEAVMQMIDARPANGGWIWTDADSNHDGNISGDELAKDSLFGGVLAPDVQLTDGEGHLSASSKREHRDSLSFGIGIHLAPCPTGGCVSTVVANHCDDRSVDEGESDVDCGAICMNGCVGGLHCATDSDCLAGRCDGGQCAPTGCSDGLRDGLETDIDCGNGCRTCADGAKCLSDDNCTSHRCRCSTMSCDGGFICQTVPAHCSDGVVDGDESDVDCGGSCGGCATLQRCNVDSDCSSFSCYQQGCAK